MVWLGIPKLPGKVCNRDVRNDVRDLTALAGSITTLKEVWHGMTCMIRFVWFLFGFKISSYKSEEIELILSFKNCVIQTLMHKVITILQLTGSD